MVVAVRLAFVVASLVLMARTSLAEDEVRLVSGDVLRGKIVTLTDKELVLEHADLGRVIIPVDKIQSHTKLESAPVEAEPSDPSALEEEIDAVLAEKTKKEKLWKFSTTVGGSLTNDDDGEKLKFNLRGHAARKDKHYDTVIRTTWIYSTDNSVTDENTFSLTGSHSRRFDKSRWFIWGKARYDYDDFRDWRQRATLHAGSGFDIFRTKKLDFALFAGVGGRKEFGTADDTTLEAEGALGLIVGWRPRERHKLAFELSTYPGLTDDTERLILLFDWSILIDRKIGMSINTHLDWEYDSRPDSGFPPNTIRWTWGLQFDF